MTQLDSGDRQEFPGQASRSNRRRAISIPPTLLRASLSHLRLAGPSNAQMLGTQAGLDIKNKIGAMMMDAASMRVSSTLEDELNRDIDQLVRFYSWSDRGTKAFCLGFDRAC